MKIARLRYIFVIQYLALAAVALCGTYFTPDHSPELSSISLSELLLMLLTYPWSGLFLAFLNFAEFGSNLVFTLGILGCLAINAAIFYYLGVKFEKAPDKLF